MQSNREPKPLTKEQAEQIASEWLDSARKMGAPIKRGSINWLWVLPAWVVGMVMLICGIYFKSQVIEGLGLALALFGAYMALRPIESLADCGAKLSAIPSSRLLVSLQLISGVIVVCLIVYYRYSL
jgi:hypothetical protein